MKFSALVVASYIPQQIDLSSFLVLFSLGNDTTINSHYSVINGRRSLSSLDRKDKKKEELKKKEQKKDFSFFEGSEKKLEIVVENYNLRSFGKKFWKKMIDFSKCSFLSVMSNSYCDAYLLSESSLFVWDERFTMITCGKTTLVDSAIYFLRHISKENLKLLIYERKNEYFPFHQSSDFYQDVKKLKKEVNGKAFLFGEKAGHHLLLFHSESNFNPPQSDTTFEILMYNFQNEVQSIFNKETWDKDEIRQLTHLDKLFPEFKKEDHFFLPQGYSLNAIRKNNYYTIHITKESFNCLYISFETNLNFEGKEKEVSFFDKLIALFRPQSFDVISLKPIASLKLKSIVKPKDTPLRSDDHSILGERKSESQSDFQEIEIQDFKFNFDSYIGVSSSTFLGQTYGVHFCHFFHKFRTLVKVEPIEII